MAYSDLSMQEKAQVIRMGVQAGLKSLKDIQSFYDSMHTEPEANDFAEGGSIHIAPSKRGTFTAAATKHGKSVQAFASQVLANKENYSPAMVKKANFARNFGGHRHDDGGYLGNEFENGGKKKITDSPLYKQSAKIMEGVRRIRNYENLTGYNQADWRDYLEQFMIGYRGGNLLAPITPSGTPQDTYLLPAKMFDKALLEAGYTHGQPKDYGTVNRAATNLGQKLGRDIPVYQAYPDAISKDSLIHLGSDVELLGALDRTYPGERINPVILEHAGDYASAYYMNPETGQLYLKGWDLNDYSPASQGHNSYNNTLTTLSSLLDKVGNPAVYTTGFQPVRSLEQSIFMQGEYPSPDKHLQAFNNRNLKYREQMEEFHKYQDAKTKLEIISDVLTPLMEKKGLYKHVVDDQYFFSPLQEEVVVTPNKKSTGGPMYPFSFSKQSTPTVRYADGGYEGEEFIPNENIQSKQVWLNKGTRFQKQRPGTVNTQNIRDTLDSSGPDNQYIWDSPTHESYSAYKRNPNYRPPLIPAEPIKPSNIGFNVPSAVIPKLQLSLPARPSLIMRMTKRIIPGGKWIPVGGENNGVYGYQTFHLENSPLYGIEYQSVPGSANAGEGSIIQTDSLVRGIPIQELNQRIFDYKTKVGGNFVQSEQ